MLYNPTKHINLQSKKEYNATQHNNPQSKKEYNTNIGITSSLQRTDSRKA
jgi:hypothetical protein